MRRHTAPLALAIVVALCSPALLASSAFAAAEAPQISDTAFAAVTETTATLQATLDPGEKKTEYHFVYVDQAGFEAAGFADAASAPVPAAEISEELTVAHPVSVPISGLIPGTTYHFRLVAHNSKSPSGGTPGPEAIFATYSSPPTFGLCPANETFRFGPSAALPDCRAYEQVSPIDKDGGDLTGPPSFVKAAIGGGAVTFLSSTGVPVSDPSLSGSQELPLYLGSRGEGGWSTQGLLPPADAGQGAQVIGWLPDFSESFDVAESFAGKPRPRALFARPTDGGALTPIAPYTPGAEYYFAGATVGGSEVVFEMATRDLAGHLGTSTVYAWNRAGGRLSLVSVLNDGEAPSARGSFAGPYDWVRGTTPTTLGEGGAARKYYTQDEHAVAADGSVYFTAGGSGKLYERLNPTAEQSLVNGAGECIEHAKACTIEVSASEKTNGPPPLGTDPAGAAPAAFQAAAADGSKAFFTSSEKLTDDATTGPEPPAPAIGRANIADGTGKQEAFLPPAAGGVAVDGSHIYWADAAKGTIGRAELDGGDLQEEFISEEVGNPQYVAVDGEHIYWTNAAGGKDEEGTIGRANLNGSEPKEDFIGGASNPQGIAVDAEHVYWANGGERDPTRSIGRAAIGGGEVNQDLIDIKPGNSIPQAVAVDGDHLYWSSNEERTSYVGRAKLDGEVEVESIFVGKDIGVRGIAVDGGHLYWATQAGTIGRGNLELAAVEPVFEPAFIEAAGKLKGVAVDGSHIYWSANGELSPNPGNDLYRYDYDASTGIGKLSDLTVDGADPNGIEVQGVLGAGDDGSYVYFAANGVPTGVANTPNAQGESATPGTCSGHLGSGMTGVCNLYLWHEGEITFIAQLDISGNASQTDAFDWAASPTKIFANENLEKTAMVAADGRTLLFRSQRKLTDYENEGIPEFYLYRAGDPGLNCVSCNPTGAPPAGAPTLGTIVPVFLTPAIPASVASRNLSAAGDRVFFQTTDALVSADTNGDAGCPIVGGQQLAFPSCQDVYEWEADGSGSCRSQSEDGGCLYLLSTGKSNYTSFFADASASGADAFIFTRSQLVGQDRDELLDIYDAREGGGLASQNEPPPPPPCEGETCKPSVSAAPPSESAGSATFSGPGNERPKHHRKKQHKKHHRSKHHKKHRQAADHKHRGGK